METNEIFLGTEFKLNINIEPVEPYTMDDFDFFVDIYCSAKRVFTITKEHAIRIDENNYVVCVDSAPLGAGELKVKITAYIPDNDFDDSLRTEVHIIDTGLQIIKNLS